MTRPVIITCALTGDSDTRDRSPHVPIPPAQIAEDAMAAAAAGAAIVHIHVRDPETGKGSRQVGLYREVTERIAESGVDVVVNLTAGMGGKLIFGADKMRTGEIAVFGKPVVIGSPIDAIRCGIMLCTEDKLQHGLSNTLAIFSIGVCIT